MDTINQMQTDANLEEVETQYMVDQYEALCRIEKTDDWKTLIFDGYFRDRAVNSVSLLATDYIRNSGKRPEVMEVLVAISNLQDHFHMIKSLGGVPAEEAAEANGPEV